MIYQHIRDFAEKTPDRVAIRRNGVNFSFGSFADAILSARGEFIRRRLTGPGVVGVAVTDLQQAWISALALRSLGATVLPIRSPEVLVDVLHSGVTSIVGDENWSELKDACHENNLLFAHAPTPMGRPSNVEGQRPPIDGGHILVSSGTTGRAKMVLYGSKSDEATSSWLLTVDHTTMFQVFDYGLWTGAGYRFAAKVWSRGGGIIVQQLGERHEALRDLTATHAVLVPSSLSEILQAPVDAFPCNKDLNLYLGGGTVTAAQIHETKRRITPRLFSTLAATEVGWIGCTALDCTDDHRWHRIVPGRKVQIVNDQNEPVPVGQQGQLRVAVGRGPSEYFKDPKATAAFFRDGYFYPGDLAVERADGRIALQGRTTDVINIKGSKFSPVPFEDHLREVFGFTGVCLLSMQDEQGEEQLYLVVELSQPVPHQLVDLLQRKFPVVALSVYSVAALPRTPSGKVIRSQVQAGVQAAVCKVRDDVSLPRKL